MWPMYIFTAHKWLTTGHGSSCKCNNLQTSWAIYSIDGIPIYQYALNETDCMSATRDNTIMKHFLACAPCSTNKMTQKNDSKSFIIFLNMFRISTYFSLSLNCRHKSVEKVSIAATSSWTTLLLQQKAVLVWT